MAHLNVILNLDCSFFDDTLEGIQLTFVISVLGMEEGNHHKHVVAVKLILANSRPIEVLSLDLVRVHPLINE